MHQLRVLGLVACCVWLSWTGTVHADAVTDWNEIAVQTIIAGAPRAPGARSSFLDMAIVQAAVYDAVQAIDRRFEPYHVEIPEPPAPRRPPPQRPRTTCWSTSSRAGRVPRHDLPTVPGCPRPVGQ